MAETINNKGADKLSGWPLPLLPWGVPPRRWRPLESSKLDFWGLPDLDSNQD